MGPKGPDSHSYDSGWALELPRVCIGRFSTLLMVRASFGGVLDEPSTLCGGTKTAERHTTNQPETAKEPNNTPTTKQHTNNQVTRHQPNDTSKTDDTPTTMQSAINQANRQKPSSTSAAAQLTNSHTAYQQSHSIPTAKLHTNSQTTRNKTGKLPLSKHNVNN